MTKGRRACWALCVVILTVPVAEAQVVLRGTVVDAETGAPLAAAHVTELGAGDEVRGTITNGEGRFELAVLALPVTLEARYIGYGRARATFDVGGAREQAIRLAPEPIPLGEVFVTGDDFAASLVRKALDRKARQHERLRTYQAEVYSRLTLSNRTGIVLVSETVADALRDRERGAREVVRARRETGDFYRRFGLEPAIVPNFYDDEVPLRGLRFLGPLHPDALDLYTFSLAGRRVLDGRLVYDLYLAPKTLVQPTFIGRIALQDETYTLLEAELRPARHVVFPAPTEAFTVFLRQQFAPLGDLWLPVDFRAEGRIQLREGDRVYDLATLRLVARFDEVRANEPLPAAPYAQAERVVEDEDAALGDYLYLRGWGLVPLTTDETVALRTLRADPPSLEEAFSPLDAARAAFEALRGDEEGPQFRWPVIYGYAPWLRFNRVDGYGFGIGWPLELSPRLRVDLQAAQVTGLERIRFAAEGRTRWGRAGFARLRYARDTETRYESHLYAAALASLQPLLGGPDYFDYLWSRRLEAEVGTSLGPVRGSATLERARHEAVEQALSLSWPFARTLRANPAVPEGLLVAGTVRLAAGDPYRPLRTGGLNHAGLEVELSDPAWGSDFRYGRVRLRLDGYARTFFRQRLRPMGFHARAFAGASWGTLPPQKSGVLDAGLGLFHPLGAFRTLRGRPYEGARWAGLFWEHDFSTLPFEGLGPGGLADQGMGLRLFGGHGRTWDPPPLPEEAALAPTAWHHELGLGLTRLFGTPLRLDLARRLGAPAWFVGIGVTGR